MVDEFVFMNKEQEVYKMVIEIGIVFLDNLMLIRVLRKYNNNVNVVVEEWFIFCGIDVSLVCFWGVGQGIDMIVEIGMGVEI